MSRLLLLRHAKAGWAEPGTRDFDRDLEPSGRDDALAIGRAIAHRGYRPDRVLCSTARRARATWGRVAGALRVDHKAIAFTEALYSADAAGYLEIVRKAEDVQTLLIVGHNPMIEDVAFALSGHGEESARLALATGFPTAGLAVIVFDDPLSLIAPGEGTLEAFLSPTDG